MSKQAYTVFEPVGFTEPIPGLRRRPMAARITPIVERIDTGEPRWSATLPPDQAESREAGPSARGRAAPLATGVVLLVMAGAGWAMLQASSPPLQIPPLAELTAHAAPSVAALPSEGLTAQAPVAEASDDKAAEASAKPAVPAEASPATPPAKPTPQPSASIKTAAVKPGKGDLLKTLPAPATGQAATPALQALPPGPSAMPTAPLALPASAPASATAESKPEVTPPQPPASAASSS